LRNASRLLILPNPEDNTISKEFLNKEACLSFAKEFIIQSAEVESFNKNSDFESYLQSGIASLKTVFCSDMKFEIDGKQHNNLCPCCNNWIHECGKKVPSTPKHNSFLICRISGKQMNEDNPPVVLPNNHVYSNESIRKLVDRNNGIITCPITGQKFTNKEVNKIYLTS